MRVVIDRKEGNQVVVELEGGETVSVPESLFPDASEGMVFNILRDREMEEEMVGRVKSLFDKLKKE